MADAKVPKPGPHLKDVVRDHGFKHKINPYHVTSRRTLCQNIREMYRRFEAAGDQEGMELAAAAFSFGKAMDARLKYYKHRYEPNRVGPEVGEADI